MKHKYDNMCIVLIAAAYLRIQIIITYRFI